jgi:phosphomannomutase
MPIQITANYQSAFKDADIRGVYPTELDEEIVYLIARSFIDEYGFTEIVVGRDMRVSSPALYEAFCKGAVDAGAIVTDLGLVSTPMVYFASGSLALGGVMITASHSPREFNGLKLVLPGAIPLTEKHGLKSIRKRMEKGVFIEPKKKGKIRSKDISKAYQKKVLSGSKGVSFQGMKVLVDCGNGMSSVIMPLIAEKLPVAFTTLFTELDGRFPNRGSDPTLKKNQRTITQTLKAGGYDFGISFDGDADRVAFFDEKGSYINSAIIGAVIAERLLAKYPGAKMVYTNLTSRIYEERIRAAGGKPVPARVGHAFIKETMRTKDAVFGCEHSGHFYFKEYFYTDSATITLRYVLEAFAEAKKHGQTFSAMMAPYCIYEQTEDTIVDVVHKKEALESVHKWLIEKQPQQIKRFDGYYANFGDVWGSVKISVTEHALKMMFEGYSKKKAQALQDDMVAFVKSIANL